MARITQLTILVIRDGFRRCMAWCFDRSVSIVRRRSRGAADDAIAITSIRSFDDAIYERIEWHG